MKRFIIRMLDNMITNNNDESTKKRGVIKIKIEDADSKPSTSQKQSEDVESKTENSTMSPVKDSMFPMIEMPSFNEPKLEGAGEDADPISLFDKSSGIGLVCVFDGLGGAGSRIYKDRNGEEHTAAYIASRVVRKIIQNIYVEKIESRQSDTALKKQFSRQNNQEGDLHENIFSDMEEVRNEANSEETLSTTNVREFIKEFLVEIKPDNLVAGLKQMTKGYISKNESAFDSLSSEFPTTMAGCVYYIDKEKELLELNCFWAGDSRVYLFDVDKMHFLTTDDADAPDGDPFSPENMDLKMSQCICLDKPFTIHFDSMVTTYSAEKPLLLMAATDGCFGYFRNPILFEKMVRESLLCDNSEQWANKTKQAIIDNGRHDDLSMASVIVGTGDMKTAGEVLSKRLRAEIFESYDRWINDFAKQRRMVNSTVDSLMQERIQLLSEIKQLHTEIESYKDVGEKISAKSKEIAEMETLIAKLKEDLDKMLAISDSVGGLKGRLSGMESLKQEKDKAWESEKKRLEEMDLMFKQKNNSFYKEYRNSIV